MILQELFEILKTTGLSVWKYEAFQKPMPFIVYQDIESRFDTSSGTVWRKTTKVGIDVYSTEDCDSETLERVLLKNKLIPTSITKIYIPEGKIINTQFDVNISQEIYEDDLL